MTTTAPTAPTPATYRRLSAAALMATAVQVGTLVLDHFHDGPLGFVIRSLAWTILVAYINAHAKASLLASRLFHGAMMAFLMGAMYALLGRPAVVTGIIFGMGMLVAIAGVFAHFRHLAREHREPAV